MIGRPAGGTPHDVRWHSLTLHALLVSLLAAVACGGATDDDTEADGSPYPPGCSDGGGPLETILRGENEIVITTLFHSCAEPEVVGTYCSDDDFEYVLTLEDGIAPGTYDLADPGVGVTYARTRHWDHTQSDEACVCDGVLDDTPVPITSGTISIEATDIEGYVWTLGLGEGLPPFSGFSSVPEPCESGG